MQKPGENIPNPDPSLLTTAQLFREVGSLKELIDARLTGIEDRFAVLKMTSDQFPERIIEELKHLRVLYDEKFRGVYDKFADNKAAVDKAFEASEKANGEQNRGNLLAMSKTEAAFTKQIEASDGKIDDVKERVTVLESRAQGNKEGMSAAAGMVLGAIAAASCLVSIAAVLFNILHR